MNKAYDFYDAATGNLVGRSYGGPLSDLAANTPAGHAAVEGRFDHLSQRVDLALLAAKTAAIAAAQAALDAAGTATATAMQAQRDAAGPFAAATQANTTALAAQAFAQATLEAAITDEEKAAAQTALDAATARVAATAADLVAAQVPVDAANVLMTQAFADQAAAQAALDAANALVVVVDYRPPAPADTDLATWSWDAATRRNVSTPTLKQLKLAKWEEVKSAAALSDQTDLQIGANTYHVDLAERAAFFQQCQYAVQSNIASVTWHTATDDPVTLTRAQIVAGIAAIVARSDAIKAKALTLRALGVAATTPADVAKISWSWP